MKKLNKTKLKSPIIKHYVKVKYMVYYYGVDSDEEIEEFEVESSDIKEITFKERQAPKQTIIEVETFDKILSTYKGDNNVYTYVSDTINNKSYLVGEFLTTEEALKKYDENERVAKDILSKKDKAVGVGCNRWYYRIVTEEERDSVIDYSELNIEKQ